MQNGMHEHRSSKCWHRLRKSVTVLSLEFCWINSLTATMQIVADDSKTTWSVMKRFLAFKLYRITRRAGLGVKAVGISTYRLHQPGETLRRSHTQDVREVQDLAVKLVKKLMNEPQRTQSFKIPAWRSWIWLKRLRLVYSGLAFCWDRRESG